jgi:hypothetical protein
MATFKDLLYGDLLHSPDFKVDFAVGMTYSMSLEAMLLVPLSLSTHNDLSDNLFNSQFQLTESIRNMVSKMAIFCNAGQISIPTTERAIYPMLEDCIFQVNQKGSFHPKIWIIKETNQLGASQIKLIVLSRNLTFDNCLDIAVSMTGKINDKPNPDGINKPLIDLVRYLTNTFAHNEKSIKSGKYDNLISICEDLTKVDKFEVEEPFDDYKFYPFNPDLGYGLDSIRNDIQGREVFVVSPFISKNMLDLIVKKARFKAIITRSDFIDQDVINSFDEIYTVNDGMLENKYASINLHAKMYFVNHQDGYNYLFIGSANATHSAFNKNTEFLVRFKYKPYLASFDKFKDELINEDHQFIPVNNALTNEVEYSKPSIEEMALKRILSSKISAHVYPDNEKFNVEVALDIDNEIDIYIAPLQKKVKRAKVINRCAVIKDLKCCELSELFIVTVGTGENSISTVIKLPTSGIPENRDSMIFQSIIDTKSKFIDYMSLKFTDNAQIFIYDKDTQEQFKSGKSKSKNDVIYTSLYEDILKKFYSDPNCIDDVEDIIKLVNENVVPDSFMQMYNTFKEAQKYIKLHE